MINLTIQLDRNKRTQMPGSCNCKRTWQSNMLEMTNCALPSILCPAISCFICKWLVSTDLHSQHAIICITEQEEAVIERQSNEDVFTYSRCLWPALMHRQLSTCLVSSCRMSSLSCRLVHHHSPQIFTYYTILFKFSECEIWSTPSK